MVRSIVVGACLVAVGCGARDENTTEGSMQSTGSAEPDVAGSTSGGTSGGSNGGEPGSMGSVSSDGSVTSGSSGGGTDGDELPTDSASVEFCDPTASDVWQIERGGAGAAVFADYSCTRSCDDYADCTFDDEGFTAAAIVVDGMGATVRWQLGEDLVFMHNGGTGTMWPSGLLVEETLGAGHGVAMLRWDLGSSYGEQDMGWASRPDEHATDLVRLTARIAAVMAWADTTLNTGRMATAGCSAGAYVTFAARLWHGFGDRLAYQLFVGGPPFHSLDSACGAETSPEGRCSDDPSQICTDDGDCADPQALCSLYVHHSAAPLPEIVDSVHLTAPACETGGSDPAWDASGMFTVDGDWTSSYPVDFLVNMGPGFGDPEIGALPSIWDVAQGLSGDEVGWYQRPGTHCEGFSSPQAWNLLRTGMGWAPTGDGA